MLEVEGHLEVVLRRVRPVPVLERDHDVVEEPPIDLRDGPQGEPDDADEVEVEDRDVLVVGVGRRRPGLAAAVVDRVQAVQQFQGVPAIELGRFGLGDEVLVWEMSAACKHSDSSRLVLVFERFCSHVPLSR